MTPFYLFTNFSGDEFGVVIQVTPIFCISAQELKEKQRSIVTVYAGTTIKKWNLEVVTHLKAVHLMHLKEVSLPVGWEEVVLDLHMEIFALMLLCTIGDELNIQSPK